MPNIFQVNKTMKSSKLLKTILLISGLVAISVGSASLFFPGAFYQSNGIELGKNVSLINEIKAPGGALIASGLLIMLGAFFKELSFTSIVLSSSLYMAYGLTRLLSIGVDGMPSEALVQAAILELVIGLVCVFALVKYRTAQVSSSFN